MLLILGSTCYTSLSNRYDELLKYVAIWPDFLVTFVVVSVINLHNWTSTTATWTAHFARLDTSRLQLSNCVKSSINLALRICTDKYLQRRGRGGKSTNRRRWTKKWEQYRQIPQRRSNTWHFFVQITFLSQVRHSFFPSCFLIHQVLGLCKEKRGYITIFNLEYDFPFSNY